MTNILHDEFLTSPVSVLRPNEPVFITAKQSISQALSVLKGHRFGSVPIVDDDGVLVGIFTERDVLLRVALENLNLTQTPISQVMSSPVRTIKMNTSVARAMYNFGVEGIRHLPVQHAGRVVGIVSTKEIIDYIYEHLAKKVISGDPEVIADESLVTQFFESPLNILQPYPPVTASIDTSLRSALELLRANNVGSVVLSEDGKRVSGIFTERDYLLKVALTKKDLDKTPVSEVMTPHPETALEVASVSSAFSMLSDGGFRHIPLVTADENLVGLLSVRNFFDALADSIVQELSEST